MAKRKKKIQVSAFLSIFYILSSLYLIRAILYFNKIENSIRYTIVSIIVLFIAFSFYVIFFRKKKRNRKLLSVFFVLFIVINLFIGYNLTSIYSRIASLNKKMVYSVTMVTLKENETKYSDLNNLKKKNVGILSKDADVELYNLSVVSINSNNLINNTINDSYQTEYNIITDLLDKKLDVAFLPTNYIDILDMEMFEDMENPEKELEKIVAIKKVNAEKEVSKEEEKLVAKPVDINKPFTVLFLGVDSTADKISSGSNGDSVMLLTFNPKTMNITMVSVPRDSYIYLTCRKTENKLTHAGRNTSCMISSLERLFGLKINYYVKINFRGVVKLVDEVGGIEVDVPYDVCEQDSRRRWGKYTVYVDKGKRVINGEQALALSRNRKHNITHCTGKYTVGNRDDFTRGANQQLVLMALIDKLKNYTNLTNFQSLLKVISNNMDTNMSTDTIFSYYDLFKEILLNSASDKLFNIQRLVLKGSGQKIYDERAKRELDNVILNNNSLNAVKDAMKVNLGKASIKPIKTFDYKYGENYAKNIIGNITYGQNKYDLLPDLVGKTESYVRNYANTKGLILKVEYVSDTSKANGIVTSQNYPRLKRLDLISDKTLTIKVVENRVNCLTSTSEVCKVPDFVGKTITSYTQWKNKMSNTLKYTVEEVESESAEGTIISQSAAAGTSVKELLDNSHVINFKIAKKKVVEVVEP